MPATVTVDDRPDLWDLVDTAAAGGRAGVAAFAALFDATFDQVYAYAARRTGSQEIARDITAETFERALRRIGTLQRVAGSPVAWLYRIASNLIVDHYRKPSTKLSTPVADISEVTGAARDRTTLQTPGADTVAADRLEATGLWEGVRRLQSELQRDVLILRFQHGMTAAEVAGVLGRSVAAVKVLQMRGLRALRRDPAVRALLPVLDGRTGHTAVL